VGISPSVSIEHCASTVDAMSKNAVPRGNVLLEMLLWLQLYPIFLVF
jgi:hypothetical protein